ncbi:hypothetical protein ABIC08_009097 [Bradyrhizobium sp. RT9b]|uniref:hypothetical protein n=1 Tax=Bradyrhizobium sp. RT9b TaxID=3156385 RepID=UPI003394A7E4
MTAPVFARLNDSHGFDLRCLPANFGGKLRTAPIVPLYLSPGFSETDVRIARSKEGQADRQARIHGPSPGGR